jgi:hypothetical protein
MVIAFIFGALGAISGEILKLWEQFRKMSEAKFRKLLRSGKFWAMAAILAFVGGLGGIFTREEGKDITLKLCFLSGAGAMMLVRNAASVAAYRTPTRKLGVSPQKPPDPNEITFKDVLG